VSIFLDNLNTIIERFVTYVLWTVPIIFVYWPTNRTWYGTTKTPKRHSSNINETQQQQYQTLLSSNHFDKPKTTANKVSLNKNDSDSSSSDDEYNHSYGISAAPIIITGQSAQFVLGNKARPSDISNGSSNVGLASANSFSGN